MRNIQPGLNAIKKKGSVKEFTDLAEALSVSEEFIENNFIKVYKGLYKSKKMLFGCIKLKEF